MKRRVRAMLVVMSFVLAGCAQGALPAGTSGTATGGTSAPTDVPATSPISKRVVIAIMGDPNIVLTEIGQHNVPGTDGLQSLVHTGLARVNDQGRLDASLAA